MIGSFLLVLGFLEERSHWKITISVDLQVLFYRTFRYGHTYPVKAFQFFSFFKILVKLLVLPALSAYSFLQHWQSW